MALDLGCTMKELVDAVNNAGGGGEAYHIEVTSTSGSITQEQFDALKADKGSYVVRKSGNYEYVYNFWQFTSTTVATNTALTYVNINGSTVYFLYIKNNLTFTTSTTSLQYTSYRASSITDSNKTSTYYYPSIAAVVNYFGRITKVTGASLSVYNLADGLYEWTGDSTSTKKIYTAASTYYTIPSVPNGVTYILVMKSSDGTRDWKMWNQGWTYFRDTYSLPKKVRHANYYSYDSDATHITVFPANCAGKVSYLGNIDVNSTIRVELIIGDTTKGYLQFAVTDGSRLKINVERSTYDCFLEVITNNNRLYKMWDSDSNGVLYIRMLDASQSNSFTYSYNKTEDLWGSL